jgi:2-polyprenyl-3-methyl-5-hydroxy-6-metoxy-1,4-benzoquinol methylase
MNVYRSASGRSGTLHDISSTNLAAYRARTVVTDYQNSTKFQPAEEAIFTLDQSEFQGTRLLDIGVGSGRTTPHMLRISENYTGIDYSPELIKACREQFPSIRFEVRDARRMSDFQDA